MHVFGSAGFVVLDIVEPVRDAAPIHFHVGGTAGNMAMILGALGWESWPFARLRPDDSAWSLISSDLQVFGVHEDFLTLTPGAKLPIIVQRKRVGGRPQPIFTTRCPRCGSRMPGWSPITGKSAEGVLDRLPRFRFFLLDRFTPGNLALADRARQDGATVVFAPAALKAGVRAEVNRFRHALDLADVVIYSDRQFPEIDEGEFPRSPALEIQTRGEAGIRYRRRSAWDELAAFPLAAFDDPAGAGDWLMAVVLHLIGSDDLEDIPDDRLREILAAGQAAGGWACGFPGARGGMYGDPDRLREYVAGRTGTNHPLTLAIPAGAMPSRDATLQEIMPGFCPTCRGDGIQAPEPPPGAAGDFGAWQEVGRPGQAGKGVAEKQARLNRRYGPGNHRIVVRWNDEVIPREQALELYAEAYVQHLDTNRQLLDWLAAVARDVYDNSPSDVESGTDFSIQRGPAVHLQDIAVRIAMERLGRTFQGTELVCIRGKNSAGSMLSPGVVPFHEHESIVTPELSSWWRPGSVESFWQSNKILEVREWESRIFVFGGSFNPIHRGHLGLAELACEKWGFDKVVFVPNGDNYMKKTLHGTPAAIRFEMVEAATAGDSRMEVLDVEVKSPIRVRTPITMRELSEQYPRSQLALFRGLDSLYRTHRDCFALPNLIVLVVDREGFAPTFAEVLERNPKFDPVRDRIVYMGDAYPDRRSSTEVRRAICEGRPIDKLVPPAVEKIIEDRGLYR